MRTDYFAGLSVPIVPGSSPSNGDGTKSSVTRVSPVSPPSPTKNTKQEKQRITCHDCLSHELLPITGKDVAGCVRRLDSGPWREEWRRIPEGLTNCTAFLPKESTIH